MTQTEIENALKGISGTDFVTSSQVAQFFGNKDPHTVRYILYGLPKIKNKFFVKDVAKAILANVCYNCRN